LSESLVHVILIGGVPSAKHFNVTFPLSFTVFPVILVMIDGTESRNQRGEES